MYDVILYVVSQNTKVLDDATTTTTTTITTTTTTFAFLKTN